MPIRAENRDRYPKDWPAIRYRILQRAENRCEWCGAENYRLGGRSESGSFLPARPTGTDGMRLTWPAPGDYSWCGSPALCLRVIRIVLTIAHLDHTPENCSDENLAALCQRCHNRHDAKMRAAGVRSRRRAAAAIGELV